MNSNIIEINYKDKKIYLVKTAHISRNSIEDVRSCVEEVNPDAIAIELDEERYQSLSNNEAWREMDIIKVIKDNKVGFLLVNTILASFQKRMAKSMDSSSGGEMLEGIRLAKEKGLELVLADRSVKTTFSRIWHSLGLMEKAKLLATVIGSIFEDEEISEEELQSLKEADALEAALSEVGKQFPNVKKVLVDERDAYLSQKIKSAKGKKVVAIIGAAHCAGIIRNLDNDINTAELDKVVKKKGFGSIIKWLIPALVIFMVAYTLFKNRDMGFEQIRLWLLWNGSLSAIGTLLAGGHILSIITAFIAAPITSLNPLMAAGWFAGIVEAMVRKPKVKDFEDLSEDTSTIKGFWKNGVTRILLVVIFANVFSTIGTFISGLGIFKSFLNII